jgi:hypothetical protein
MTEDSTPPGEVSPLTAGAGNSVRLLANSVPSCLCRASNER